MSLSLAKTNNLNKEFVLGVSSSIKEQNWKFRSADERISLAISQRLQIPEIISKIISSRGITLDDAEVFLNPKLRDTIPDPFTLKDMQVESH